MNSQFPESRCEMEMRSLQIEHIDPVNDPRWDSFVERHPLGWITHLSDWKRILEESFGHMKGYYLAITDHAGGEIRAGLPVFDVKSWLLGRRLVSIPFATLSDPLVACREDFEFLSEGLYDLSKMVRTKSVEIRTYHASNLIGSGRMEPQFFYKNHYLTLDRDPELLQASFHRSCVRQRIRKALKSSLKLRIGEGEHDLLILYGLYVATRKRLGLPPQPYRFFKKIWDVLHPTNLVSLLIAEHGGKPVAAVLLFKFKERASVEVSAMDEESNEVSPIHFLYWEGIKLAWHEGYKTFDFGRTSPLNKSLMEFKGRWGTEVAELPVFYYPRQEIGYEKKETGLKNELFIKIFKKTPDPVFSFMGQLCYRHMG